MTILMNELPGPAIEYLQSCTLTRNFEWQPQLDPLCARTRTENMREYMQLDKEGQELRWRKFEQHPDTFSRPLPTIPFGGFALYPMQLGLVGALSFATSELGIKGLVIGFDTKFELTLAIIAEDADIDISEMYRWVYPFAELQLFKHRLYYQTSTTSRGFVQVLQCAFEGRSEEYLPKHVHIIRNVGSLHDTELRLREHIWTIDMQKTSWSHYASMLKLKITLHQ